MYVRLTDAAGEYAIRMDLVRLDDEESVARVEALAAIPDRMIPHELTFEVPTIPCDRAGAYEFRLSADGRFVGAAVLLVDEEVV